MNTPSNFWHIVYQSGHFRCVEVGYYNMHPTEFWPECIVDTAPSYLEAAALAGMLNTTAEVMGS